MIRICFFAAALVMAGYTPVFAYIDPGAGSYVYQVLIAGLLAFLFLWKSFWRMAADFVRKIFRKRRE